MRNDWLWNRTCLYRTPEFCPSINFYLTAESTAPSTAFSRRLRRRRRLDRMSRPLINARKTLKLILPMPLLASASWTRLLKRDFRSDPIYPAASLEVPFNWRRSAKKFIAFHASKRLDGQPKAKLIVLTAVH